MANKRSAGEAKARATDCPCRVIRKASSSNAVKKSGNVRSK